jgi:hypothetical protein
MQEVIAFFYLLKLEKERIKWDKMYIKYFLFIDNHSLKQSSPYKLIHLPRAWQGKFENKWKLLWNKKDFGDLNSLPVTKNGAW